MKRKGSLILSALAAAIFFITTTALAAPILHFDYVTPITAGDTFTVDVLMDLNYVDPLTNDPD